MKHIAAILFVIIASICISFADQENSNQKEIDCFEMAKAANESYTQAIREAEKSNPFDKNKVEAALAETYNSFLKNMEKCISSPAFVSQLVYFDLANDNPQLAFQHVNAGLKKQPADASLLMRKAEVLLKLGKNSKALDVMERSYANANSNTAIMYNYCGILVEHQKWNRAVEVCTETIDACEKSDKENDQLLLPWTYVSRANAYSALGEKQEAMADVKKAKDLGLSQPWLWPKELQTEK